MSEQEKKYNLTEKGVKVFQELRDRIEKLEKENSIFENQTAELMLDKEDRITKLEEIVTCITEDDMKAGRKPHKCPLCEGKGYWHSINEINISWGGRCNSCEGKGIIWG